VYLQLGAERAHVIDALADAKNGRPGTLPDAEHSYTMNPEEAARFARMLKEKSHET